MRGETMPPEAGDLHDRLLAAHAAGDGPTLARLYAEAAAREDARGAPDAAAFFLTHAYVFALECGAADAARLRAELVARGRESQSERGAG